MQLNQRLNINHSQSIVMTPQLRQAIKLLQFSNLKSTEILSITFKRSSWAVVGSLIKLEKSLHLFIRFSKEEH